jgi:phage terminase small subunit
MSLSNKHRVFVEEYLRTWNATEAYSRAYPQASRATARANGATLLANTSIAEEIKARITELVMGPDEVLVRFAEQARAEYSAYFRPNGSVDLEQLIADGKGHLIKSIKETKYGTNVEFYDAHAARELIGKYHKLFGDNKLGANLNIDFNDLPDDVLDKLARGEDVDLAAIASQSRTRNKA